MTSFIEIGIFGFARFPRLDKRFCALILHSVPYESAVFAFMRMRGESSYADKVVKSALVQRVVVNPHPLEMQVERCEFESTIVLSRRLLEITP